MLDQSDDEVIIFTRADHCDPCVIGKDDRDWRCRICGSAIAWRIGARAVGSLVITGLRRGIGIRASLCEKVVDLADHTGGCVGAVNDHGIIDGNLLGKNFLPWPDAAVFGQDVFQVRPSDQVRHAGEGSQFVLAGKFGLGCAVEAGHLRTKVDRTLGHVCDQRRCILSGRCARNGVHADCKAFVITAEKKLHITKDLNDTLAVDAHFFEGLSVTQDSVIGLNRAFDVGQAAVEFSLRIYLCDLDGGVIDNRQFLLLQQRVNNRNGTGLNGHRDRGVEFQYVF